jgi:hypothetical protein
MRLNFIGRQTAMAMVVLAAVAIVVTLMQIVETALR